MTDMFDVMAFAFSELIYVQIYRPCMYVGLMAVIFEILRYKTACADAWLWFHLSSLEQTDQS